MLCFVFTECILPHFLPLVKSFFALFLNYFFDAYYDKNVHREKHQKTLKKNAHFLLCMLFHKILWRFSSQLDIYKSCQMRYNNHADGQSSVRFPLLHTALYRTWRNVNLMTSLRPDHMKVCNFTATAYATRKRRILYIKSLVFLYNEADCMVESEVFSCFTVKKALKVPFFVF